MKRTLVYLPVLLALLTVGAGNITRRQQLDVRIVQPERTFLVGEYIWIDIDFYNGTADTLCINSFDAERHLNLINSAGERQKSSITGGWQRPPCIPELPTDEVYTYTTEIAQGFGQSNAVYPMLHLPAGEYQLYAEGHLRSKAWVHKFPFRSEPVVVKVVEPPPEDRQVWEYLNDAWRQSSVGNKLGADSLLAMLIDRYPASAYITEIWAVYVLQLRYGTEYLGDRSEADLNRRMQFISRFPNDQAAKRTLASLPGHPLLRKDRERLMKILDQVISEYPNSLVAERACSIKTKEISRAGGQRKRE